MKNTYKMMSKFVTLALTACCLIALGLGQLQAAEKTYLNVKGSDTMVNLVSAWAENYMKDHSDVEISVTGGGSGTGIAALMNGTTEICASSRKLKDVEAEQFKQKNKNPVEFITGLDGLAVMVNKSNPISEMTLEQIKQIYTGQYSDWSEVGAPSQKILALSRESNSGTYVYFQEHVLQKKDFAPNVRLMTSTAAITQSVSQDKGAIGYGGVAYAHQADVKVISVKKDADSPAILPTDATVLDNSYPISRPLILYTDGQPSGATKDFIEYAMSEAGQKVVSEVGYIPLKK